MIYPYSILIALSSIYALWIFYLAVMNLKRAKDAGLLSKTAMILGYPVLIVGYVLDCFVNVTVMTVVLMELPRETTVTSRLKRHNKDSKGWRKAVAVWAEPLLDPFDPSGDHI
jgi:predicted transporter